MPLPRTACAVVLLIGAFVVAGCAAPPPPVKLAKTNVVLMPDEDGNVGAISVTSASGTRKVVDAYHGTSVIGTNAGPADAALVGKEAVSAQYAALLKAQPPKPKTFVLNFLLDKTVLTDQSKAMLPAVIAAVRERKPTEITIFGHADATGSEKRNQKLSADRARAIAALLKKNDPSLDRIDVQWFGASTPLVPSDSRSVQPKNRRAEVMIL